MNPSYIEVPEGAVCLTKVYLQGRKHFVKECGFPVASFQAVQMRFSPGFDISNPNFANWHLLVFALLKRDCEEMWRIRTKYGCFVAPGALLIVLVSFKGYVPMMLPMGIVFDRRYILASRDADGHVFHNLTAKLNLMPEDIHWQKYASRFRTFPAMLETGLSKPGMIVCIPVYAEPELAITLDSLYGCELPDAMIEVILLFNKSDRMTKDEVTQHDLTWKNTIGWIQDHARDGLKFLPVYLESCPDPKGGVGWARKLVMDEAARRLDQEGVMVCLDGDCTVSGNYFQVVYDYFKGQPSCDAASIHFEHKLDLPDIREMDAIAQYELHLRYLVAALRWAGHPFAFHTIGSSMAVRRKAYLLQGGMNTRQAGEDFYFLQKFIEIESLHEIKETTVFPSSRISGRVPFGTGRAMQTLLNTPGEWLTTDIDVFRLVKPLLASVDSIRQFFRQDQGGGMPVSLYDTLGLHDWVVRFLDHIGFVEQCRDISAQTTNAAAFRRRFFRYFNSFMMIRYMHFISQHFIPVSGITRSANAMLSELNSIPEMAKDAFKLLELFRQMDKLNPAR